jgi:hypothetical protein
MQVRIMLQIVGDDGTVGALEDVASLTKVTEGAEDLGLSLAESKALRAAAQQRIVEAQVDCWLEKHRHCPISGRKLRCKGSLKQYIGQVFLTQVSHGFVTSAAGMCLALSTQTVALPMSTGTVSLVDQHPSGMVTH